MRTPYTTPLSPALMGGPSYLTDTPTDIMMDNFTPTAAGGPTGALSASTGLPPDPRIPPVPPLPLSRQHPKQQQQPRPSVRSPRVEPETEAPAPIPGRSPHAERHRQRFTAPISHARGQGGAQAAVSLQAQPAMLGSELTSTSPRPASSSSPSAAHTRLAGFSLVGGNSLGSPGSAHADRGRLTDSGNEHRGPLQLSRLAHVMYPPLLGSCDDDGYPVKVAPLLRDPQAPRPMSKPCAVVSEALYYGSRGADLAAQEAAERSDEVAPAGFQEVPLRGGLRRLGTRNPYVCTAAVLLAPLVYLLVCCPIIYHSSLLRPALQAAVELSQSLDAVLTYLCSEQASAARINTLSVILPQFTDDSIRQFYTTWDDALLRFQDRHTDTNRCLTKAGTIINENEEDLEELLSGMWLWSYLDTSYLSWTRQQCITNTVNVDIMAFYDRLVRQLLLFNGALSLSMTVRIGSDIEEIRTLFSTEMASVSRVSRLYLEAKSDQAPSVADDFLIPSSKDEAVFLIRALALMEVAEVTLRFASDPVAARDYVARLTAGSGVTDPSVLPSLKFVLSGDSLSSVGFSTEVSTGMMKMLEMTYEGRPFDHFNDTMAARLLDDTRTLTTLARAYFTEQVGTLNEAVSTSERARQACLLTLICLSAVGLLYHVCKLLDYFRAASGYERLNAYTRQLRGSLLRMHSTAMKMVHLRLDDTAAERKLSRQPKLCTITAEERELYLGVSMLHQLEPFLPLPVRYPPPAVPATALVNGSAFLKPALVTRTRLVAIRVDFSCTHNDGEHRGRQQRQRLQEAVLHHRQLHRCKRRASLTRAAAAPAAAATSSISPGIDSDGGAAGDSSGGLHTTNPDARDRVSSVSSTSSHRLRRSRDSFVSHDGTTSILRVTRGSSPAEALWRPTTRGADTGSVLVNGALGASGGASSAHHAYRAELLRVLGALVNVRPQLSHRCDHSFCVQRPTSAHPGAYMHSSGDVTTVWVNLCEDMPYAALVAGHACATLVEYCAAANKPCPELTLCVGGGVVGNVSSFRATQAAAGAYARQPRPRYDELWPKSAFFAGSESDPSALPHVTVGVPVATVAEGVLAAGTNAGDVSRRRSGSLRKAGRKPSHAAAADMDLVVIATAGLSKRARATWWLRQLLGLRVKPSSASGMLGDDGGTEPRDVERLLGGAPGGGGASGSGAGIGGGDIGGQREVATRSGGGGVGLTATLTSAAAARSGDGAAERVFLPPVLPAPYAPTAAAACLTSFIVCGAITHELETVHALAELHGALFMANDAALEEVLREKAEFDRRFDATQRHRAHGDGAEGTAATATHADGSPAMPQAPLISFAGKDRCCTVDLASYLAHLRYFIPSLVPVDMAEARREYLPARDDAAAESLARSSFAEAAAARAGKKKRTLGCEVERKLHLRAAAAAAGGGDRRGAAAVIEAAPVPAASHSSGDQNEPKANADQSTSGALDLLKAFPPLTVADPTEYSAYRREVLTRAPTPMPRTCYSVAGGRTQYSPCVRAVCELRAVYAWVPPPPLAGPNDVGEAVDAALTAANATAAWLSAFNAYARLCYATAVVEPSRCVLRSAQEKEQLTTMAAAVRDAIETWQLEAMSGSNTSTAAALGEASAARLRDVAGTVADFVVGGPLVSPADSGDAAAGAPVLDETHLFPDALLSRDAIDVARLYVAANICEPPSRHSDGRDICAGEATRREREHQRDALSEFRAR